MNKKIVPDPPVNTDLTGPQRHTALAIHQVIMLAELAVNRALDNVDPA